MTARLATIARTIRDSGGVVRMIALPRRLGLTLAVIREWGGTVKMRRMDGHESPWLYLAGDHPLSRRDVLELEAAGVLTRVGPGIEGCERCEFVIADGAA